MRLTLPYRRVNYPDGTHYDSVSCNVRLALPGSAAFCETLPALIDSGAARCIFHADLAAELGVPLTSGRREMTLGIGGEQPIWIHPVRLAIPGGSVETLAGFQEELPVYALLGMEGFFEHFIVTFDGLARECQLDRIYRA